MKTSSFLAAVAAAAASATAISVSSSSSSYLQEGGLSNDQKQIRPATTPEKLAPRFDGLRFIETLVTAHR